MVSVLVIIAMALTLYVLLPLYRRQGGSRKVYYDSDADGLELLLREKEKIYNDIRDLDFEFGIGKMAEPDYRYLRNEAIKEVAHVMKQIESASATRRGNGHISDEVVEQWILDHRATKSIDLTECPACHEKTVASAKYCMHCGGALQ